MNQLKTKLAVLEQEIKDKESLHGKTADILESEQEQKRKMTEDADRKERQVAKLELSVKTLSEELVKGNEIIKKLQSDIRNYHTKLKLRNQVCIVYTPTRQMLCDTVIRVNSSNH